MEKIYAIYKGDQFIDVGTMKELSKRQHKSIKTLHFYASKAYRRREDPKGNNHYIVIKVEE